MASIVWTIALGIGACVSDSRCDAIVNSAAKVWVEQKNYRIPETALISETTEMTPNGLSENKPHTAIIVTDGKYGLIAYITNSSIDRRGNILVQMTNERYEAMVECHISSGESAVNRLDQMAGGFRSSGFRVNADSIGRIDRVILGECSRGYLVTSMFDFNRYVQEWRSSRASMDCSQHGPSDRLRHIKFFGFESEELSGIENCTFTIDSESLLVVGVRCVSNRGEATFEVQSFVDIGERKFPCDILMSYVGPDSAQYRSRTLVKVQPLDSVGFKKEQLYLSYYGLAEPNAEAIAKPKRYTGFVYLAIGVSLGLVCAFLYWRKTR